MWFTSQPVCRVDAEKIEHSYGDEVSGVELSGDYPAATESAAQRSQLQICGDEVSGTEFGDFASFAGRHSTYRIEVKIFASEDD